MNYIFFLTGITSNHQPETRLHKSENPVIVRIWKLGTNYYIKIGYLVMAEKISSTWHGTTILSVRKGDKVVIAGDGQVSLGDTIIKQKATWSRIF